jgi:Domain of unknown function (DUF6429)
MEQKQLSDTEQLTLILLYLTGFKEKNGDTLRAWKNYDFDTMDALAEKEFIYTKKTSKSVFISPQGEALAKELLEKIKNCLE